MLQDYFSSEKKDESFVDPEDYLSKLTEYLDRERGGVGLEKRFGLELFKPCKEIFLLDSNDSTQDFFRDVQDQFSKHVEVKIFSHKDDFFDELNKRVILPSHIFFSSRHSDREYDSEFLAEFMLELRDHFRGMEKQGLKNEDRPEIIFLSSVEQIRQDVIQENHDDIVDHVIPKDFSSIWLAVEKSGKIEEIRQNIDRLAFARDGERLSEGRDNLEEINDLNVIFIDDDHDVLSSLKRCSVVRSDEIGEANCVGFDRGIDAYNYFKKIKERLNGGFSSKKFFIILDGNLKKDEKLKSGDLLFNELKKLLKDDIDNITFIANSSDTTWNIQMKYLYGFLNSKRGWSKDVMGSFDLIVEEMEKSKNDRKDRDLL